MHAYCAPAVCTGRPRPHPSLPNTPIGLSAPRPPGRNRGSTHGLPSAAKGAPPGHRTPEPPHQLQAPTPSTGLQQGAGRPNRCGPLGTWGSCSLCHPRLGLVRLHARPVSQPLANTTASTSLFQASHTGKLPSVLAASTFTLLFFSTFSLVQPDCYGPAGSGGPSRCHLPSHGGSARGWGNHTQREAAPAGSARCS